MEADQTNLSSPKFYEDNNEDINYIANDVQMGHKVEGEIIEMNY
jgi:hypothetical protein